MPSIATSSDIEVKAASIYLDDYSVPASNNFLFCYKIEIQNKNNSLDISTLVLYSHIEL